jgi:hypothetical protein
MKKLVIFENETQMFNLDILIQKCTGVKKVCT